MQHASSGERRRPPCTCLQVRWQDFRGASTVLCAFVQRHWWVHFHLLKATADAVLPSSQPPAMCSCRLFNAPGPTEDRTIRLSFKSNNQASRSTREGVPAGPAQRSTQFGRVEESQGALRRTPAASLRLQPSGLRPQSHRARRHHAAACHLARVRLAAHGAHGKVGGVHRHAAGPLAHRLGVGLCGAEGRPAGRSEGGSRGQRAQQEGAEQIGRRAPHGRHRPQRRPLLHHPRRLNTHRQWR